VKPNPIAAASIAATIGLVLSGCSEPFEAPTAYANQRVLCGPEEATAWANLVDACAADFARDGSCLGHVGFRGELQGQAVAVQTHVDQLMMVEAPSSTSVPHFAGFIADASGPYFQFQMEAKNVGGSARVANPTPQVFKLADETRGNDRYEDGRAELHFRMSAGGETSTFRGHFGELGFSVNGRDDALSLFLLRFDGGDGLRPRLVGERAR
jgi:hypothetical protein